MCLGEGWVCRFWHDLMSLQPIFLSQPLKTFLISNPLIPNLLNYTWNWTAFFTILTHHLWRDYVQKNVLGEVLSAVLLNPNPDKAKICNQSTQFTTYRLRRPAQLLPNSPHSQALKPHLQTSVLILKHIMLLFFSNVSIYSHFI